MKAMLACTAFVTRKQHELVSGVQVGKPVALNQHFDDMLNAFITVFVIITLDNWTDFMYPMMSMIKRQAGAPHHG
eukprot:scaffold76217_cov18-Tisochrysis_lutea.AAC.1